MNDPFPAADRLDRLARRQESPALATAMTVMSVALLGAMVYRELKAVIRENDHDGKLRAPGGGRYR